MVYITPHPPLIVGNIGDGREVIVKDTIEALEKISNEILDKKPSVIAVVTPHGNVFSDALCINIEPALLGDFGAFGYPEIKMVFEGSPMTREVVRRFSEADIRCVLMDNKTAKQYHVSADVDHGALVPLWFIKKVYSDFQLIHINIGFLSKEKLYEAGRILSDILGEENTLIISGDLSHMLKKDAPAGYDAMGQVYDDMIVNAIKTGNLMDILDVDAELLARAGQCAQKPLELACGYFDCCTVKGDVFSYEGPLGVGYMTAKLAKGEKTSVSLIELYENKRRDAILAMREKEDDYVTLARDTIEQYVKKQIKRPVPKGLDRALYINQNGVFVSIKKEGRLRGCMGTIEPIRSSVAEEIIENAITASTRDPRFAPITEDELNQLEISVDVLEQPEEIESKDQLDVKLYGVIVSKGSRRGLLLPNLDGVNTIDEQVSIALDKASIREDDDYQLQRFKVVRH